MGALKSYLSSFSLAAHQPEDPDFTYDKLINATVGTPTTSYEIAAGSRLDVSKRAGEAATLGDDLDKIEALDNRLPHPSPHLALRGSLKS